MGTEALMCAAVGTTSVSLGSYVQTQHKPVRFNPANSNSTLPNATHPNKVAGGKYLFHCAKDHHDVRAVSALLPGEALLSTLALGGL